MGIEQTFVMLKPDGMMIPGVVDELVTRLRSSGLIIIDQAIIPPTRDLLKEHYREHYENPEIRPILENHMDFVMAESKSFWDYAKGILVPKYGGIKPFRGNLCVVWQGEGAVAITRALTGPTKPVEAQKTSPETLRAKYGCSYTAYPGQDVRLNTFNVLHASGTSEEAERESKLWLPSPI